MKEEGGRREGVRDPHLGALQAKGVYRGLSRMPVPDKGHSQVSHIGMPGMRRPGMKGRKH